MHMGTERTNKTTWKGNHKGLSENPVKKRVKHSKLTPYVRSKNKKYDESSDESI